MAFNPYNQNLYLQDLQNMRDRIDRTMQNYQQMQQQQPIPQPQIHQSFQLAPQTSPSELQSGYANNIDEVRNIFMTKNAMFDAKECHRKFEDMSEMTEDSKIKNTLMKIALREKEHYTSLKELVEK